MRLCFWQTEVKNLQLGFRLSKVWGEGHPRARLVPLVQVRVRVALNALNVVSGREELALLGKLLRHLVQDEGNLPAQAFHRFSPMSPWHVFVSLFSRETSLCTTFTLFSQLLQRQTLEQYELL